MGFIDSQLHDERGLLAQTGTLWSDTYGGTDQVLAYCACVGRMFLQAQNDLDEYFQVLNRNTCPVEHVTLWKAIVLRESMLTRAPLRYGDGAVFGSGYVFGQAIETTPTSDKLGLLGSTCLTNRLEHASLVLLPALDYLHEDGRIIFRDNPFDTPGWQVDLEYKDGVVTDRLLTLWAYRATSDRHYLRDHVGYVLGIELDSSPGYRELLNAIHDALVGGTSLLSVLQLTAAATGIAFARGDETVELVTQDSRSLLIGTDKHLYRFARAAVPVVAVGDVLEVGDNLVAAATFHELCRGQVPSWVRAISLDSNLLKPVFLSELGFENQTVDWVVESDSEGRTKMSFRLAGFPADVTEFWHDVHQRGIERGKTLAHLLDVRPDPEDEPTAESLPATVNPAEFLVKNLLRNNTGLLRIQTEFIDPQAPGVRWLNWLRRLVPPHATILLVLELPLLSDSGIIPAQDTADSFVAAEPIEDAFDSPVAADTAAWPVAVIGTCQ